jgi:triphosphoribosyl-dephospho-CoA synthase
MPPLSIDLGSARLAQCVRAACLLEAKARKPGNVHPEAAFSDLTHEHFRKAADAIAPIVAHTPTVGVGQTVLRAVAASRALAATNANLGIILLLAPLAAVPPERPLREGIGEVLSNLTNADARDVYEAIRLARPGGLGKVEREDVAGEPTGTLRDVMALAADRDTIALQYACGFADILELGLPLLTRRPADFTDNWEQAVIRLHLELLALRPDSLIARKCGTTVADQVSLGAREILDAGWPDAEGTDRRLEQFDCWLRADGNRRNPGTTADLVAATLFAAFREQLLPIPDWARLDQRSDVRSQKFDRL